MPGCVTSCSCLCPDRRPASSSISSSAIQPQERCLSTRSSSFSEGRSLLEQPGSVTRFHISSPKDLFSPASDMSSSTTSQNEDTWTGSQDDPQSDVNDGPEYLAIGNLGRRGRACSSASTNSTKSSSSKLFSSSSSQKLDSVSSLGEQGASGGGSRGLSLLRRSSFSEGQSSAPQAILKKSHVRSHSDTNVASGKLHGNGEAFVGWLWGVGVPGTGRLMLATSLTQWIRSARGTVGEWLGNLVFALSFPALHWSDGLTSCFPECPGPVCYRYWQLLQKT